MNALGPGKVICQACQAQQGTLLQRWLRTHGTAATARRFASTSKLPHASKTAKELSILRFEAGQLRPSGTGIWQRLRHMRETAPEALTADVVQASLHALQNTSSKSSAFSSRGTDVIVRCMEIAEDYYSRYRFVQQSYHDSGLPPQSDETILDWLRGLEDLRYGPASQRIWEDYLERASHSDGKRTNIGRAIAHSVIIAQIRWVQLCKLAGLRGNPQDEAIQNALADSLAILQYLHRNDLYDSISRSLNLRLAKEMYSEGDISTVLASLYGLNLEFPSTWSETLRGSSPDSKLDVHALNTLLHHYSEREDLSKMISIFENVTHEPKSGTLPDDFFSAHLLSEHVQEDRSSSDAAVYAQMESVELRSAPQELNVTDRSAICNTTSYQIIIDTAIRQSDLAIAFHYLDALLFTWQSEQSAAREVFKNWIANQRNAARHARDIRPLNDATAKEDGQDRAAMVLPNFEKPTVGPASIAIVQMFQHIKDGSSDGLSKGSSRYAVPYLKRLSHYAQNVLQITNAELAFWAEVGRRVSGQETASELDEESDGEKAVKLKLVPRLHAVLLQRAQGNVSAVSERIAVLSEKRSTDQFVAVLINRLGHKKASIPQLKTVIARAKRWLVEDEAADHLRLGAARRRLLYADGYSRSARNQTKKKLALMVDRMEARRLRVSSAVDEAEAALKIALRDKLSATDTTMKAPSGDNETAPGDESGPPQAAQSNPLMAWLRKRTSKAQNDTPRDTAVRLSGANNSIVLL